MAQSGFAFNDYSRPGWTTYPVRFLNNDFRALYDALGKHGNPSWGGVEANAGIPWPWERRPCLGRILGASF